MTDRELVQEAVRKAGTQKALAEIFGVSQSAISEWARTRGIPRHVRPRLDSYIGEHRALRGEPTEEVLFGAAGLASAMRELVEFAEMSAREMNDFPKRYRKRYDERLREVTERCRRELDDYRKLLRAEYRVEQGIMEGKKRKSNLSR